MEERDRNPSVEEALAIARDQLGRVMPPQADKILRALQQVELAVQHREARSDSRKVLQSLREALRALNQIEGRRHLPPPISVAVAAAIDSLVHSLRTIEGELVETDRNRAARYSGPERRHAKSHDAPSRRSDDDTINLFAPEIRQIAT